MKDLKNATKESQKNLNGFLKPKNLVQFFFGVIRPLALETALEVICQTQVSVLEVISKYSIKYAFLLNFRHDLLMSLRNYVRNFVRN